MKLGTRFGAARIFPRTYHLLCESFLNDTGTNFLDRVNWPICLKFTHNLCSKNNVSCRWMASLMCSNMFLENVRYINRYRFWMNRARYCFRVLFAMYGVKNRSESECSNKKKWKRHFGNILAYIFDGVRLP